MAKWIFFWFIKFSLFCITDWNCRLIEVVQYNESLIKWDSSLNMLFFELATGIKFRASYRKEAVCYHERFVPFTAFKFWYSDHYKYDLKLQFYFKISCLQLLGSYYFSCARSCIPFPTFYELKFWCIICSYLDLPDPVRGDASGSLNRTVLVSTV